MTAAAPPDAKAHPIRTFGRFALRELLGKSAATMAWLAFDPRSDEEVMLTLPRVQPADAAELDHWLRDARLAARLEHPRLAPVAEVGVQDHWPFVAVARRRCSTLSAWLGEHPQLAIEQAVMLCCDVLQGLAFAHEAGVAHLDLQLHAILVDERGNASVMALAAAGDAARRAVDAARSPSHERGMAISTDQLRLQRTTAARDVLAAGLVLHRLLAGQPALDQADIAAAIAHMAPAGRELVRLPWATPLPIPDALRAIANRCTSGQERLRYQNARTLAAALDGWRHAHANDAGGPVDLLLDRVRRVGHLPALPGLGARVARITSGEGQRTDEMADDVLQDMALAFELLRTLNSSQVQGTQTAGDAPVLTLKRVIALIGVNGVRLAANTLRPWPGPLDAAAALALKAAMDRARLAGHAAQALRPAGYDPQVVYLIALLQSLGRLLLRYHFAEEAQQIDQLMQSAPGEPQAGIAEQPGLTEEQAAFAVLGIDIESLGSAVARQWGLGEELLSMIRRVPADAHVRKPDTDAETLRIVASAANEAVDLVHRLPASKAGAALVRLAQRYARGLGSSARDFLEALQAAREALRSAGAGPTAAGRARAAKPPGTAGDDEAGREAEDVPAPAVGAAAPAAAAASGAPPSRPAVAVAAA